MYVLFTGRRAYSGGGSGGSSGSRPSDKRGSGHPVPEKKGGAVFFGPTVGLKIGGCPRPSPESATGGM